MASQTHGQIQVEVLVNGSRPEELFESEIHLGPLVQDRPFTWDGVTKRGGPKNKHKLFEDNPL